MDVGELSLNAWRNRMAAENRLRLDLGELRKLGKPAAGRSDASLGAHLAALRSRGDAA